MFGSSPRSFVSHRLFLEGVMFMWDLSAKKSLQQLDEWMEELTTMDQGPFDLEDESPGSNSHLPLLVVGNKTDRAPAERAHVSYAHTEAHTVRLGGRAFILVAKGCSASLSRNCWAETVGDRCSFREGEVHGVFHAGALMIACVVRAAFFDRALIEKDVFCLR